MSKKRKPSKKTWHYSDMDYLKKLSPKELEFMWAFQEAEYKANVSLLSKLTKVTSSLKKEFTDQHNERRRDILNQLNIDKVSLSDPEMADLENQNIAISDLADRAKKRKPRKIKK